MSELDTLRPCVDVYRANTDSAMASRVVGRVTSLAANGPIQSARLCGALEQQIAGAPATAKSILEGQPTTLEDVKH